VTNDSETVTPGRALGPVIFSVQREDVRETSLLKVNKNQLSSCSWFVQVCLSQPCRSKGPVSTSHAPPRSDPAAKPLDSNLKWPSDNN
jgi:hypothetical protein